jgi:hypothetical protein
VFTSSLQPASRRSATFLPWETAQARYVAASGAIAHTIATELLKRDIPTLTLPAAVRPLNNIAGPAIAVEIAAPAAGSVDDLNSPPYQASVCSALANAIAVSHLRFGQGAPAR